MEFSTNAAANRVAVRVYRETRDRAVASILRPFTAAAKATEPSDHEAARMLHASMRVACLDATETIEAKAVKAAERAARTYTAPAPFTFEQAEANRLHLAKVHALTAALHRAPGHDAAECRVCPGFTETTTPEEAETMTTETEPARPAYVGPLMSDPRVSTEVSIVDYLPEAETLRVTVSFDYFADPNRTARRAADKAADAWMEQHPTVTGMQRTGGELVGRDRRRVTFVYSYAVTVRVATPLLAGDPVTPAAPVEAETTDVQPVPDATCDDVRPAVTAYEAYRAARAEQEAAEAAERVAALTLTRDDLVNPYGTRYTRWAASLNGQRLGTVHKAGSAGRAWFATLDGDTRGAGIGYPTRAAALNMLSLWAESRAKNEADALAYVTEHGEPSHVCPAGCCDDREHGSRRCACLSRWAEPCCGWLKSDEGHKAQTVRQTLDAMQERAARLTPAEQVEAVDLTETPAAAVEAVTVAEEATPVHPVTPAEQVERKAYTKAERKQANREAAALLRAAGMQPTGDTWETVRTALDAAATPAEAVALVITPAADVEASTVAEEATTEATPVETVTVEEAEPVSGDAYLDGYAARIEAATTADELAALMVEYAASDWARDDRVDYLDRLVSRRADALAEAAAAAPLPTTVTEAEPVEEEAAPRWPVTVTNAPNWAETLTVNTEPTPAEAEPVKAETVSTDGQWALVYEPDWAWLERAKPLHLVKS